MAIYVHTHIKNSNASLSLGRQQRAYRLTRCHTDLKNCHMKRCSALASLTCTPPQKRKIAKKKRNKNNKQALKIKQALA